MEVGVGQSQGPCPFRGSTCFLIQGASHPLCSEHAPLAPTESSDTVQQCRSYTRVCSCVSLKYRASRGQELCPPLAWGRHKAEPKPPLRPGVPCRSGEPAHELQASQGQQGRLSAWQSGSLRAIWCLPRQTRSCLSLLPLPADQYQPGRLAVLGHRPGHHHHSGRAHEPHGASAGAGAGAATGGPAQHACAEQPAAAGGPGGRRAARGLLPDCGPAVVSREPTPRSHHCPVLCALIP